MINVCVVAGATLIIDLVILYRMKKNGRGLSEAETMIYEAGMAMLSMSWMLYGCGVL